MKIFPAHLLIIPLLIFVTPISSFAQDNLKALKIR